MSNERPAGAAGIRGGGTWGSALTSGEFAAIRSVGFEPVGQVFGAAVFGIAHGEGYSCPAIMASSHGAVGARPSGQPSGHQPEWGDQGPLGPLVRAIDQARRTAVQRLAAQCAALGGDGVVGLRVTRGSFLLGGQEFTAVGTAVRARGAKLSPWGGAAAGDGSQATALGGSAWAQGNVDRADHDAARGRPAPFTCDLSGQDFAKLIRAGWVPAGLVLGVAIGSCHDDWQTTRQTRLWSGNREVVGWTDVVNRARRDAGGRLEADARRLGAEGAVVADMRLRVSVRDCPAQVGRRDHVVEASILGTAIAAFDRAGQGTRTGQGTASPALAVLPLAPRGRRSRPRSADSDR